MEKSEMTQKKKWTVRLVSIILASILLVGVVVSCFIYRNDISHILNTYRFNEIPAVVINTKDKLGIYSKTEYSPSNVSILNTGFTETFFGWNAGVRGRGNSTWNHPKKGYRIKFDAKQSILGSKYKAKSWTLIPNYVDRSLARNEIAFSIAEKMDGLAFTSTHHYVDLYLNNEYMGVYLLCDQMQTGKGRVEINEKFVSGEPFGFMIEMDMRAEQEGVLDLDYFLYKGRYYTIKTPDTTTPEFVEHREELVEGIRNSLADALSETEWETIETLIDVNSFVDSYIVEELFENLDAAAYSWYLYQDKGGKLTAGPVWDFDLAGGNYDKGIVWKTYPPDRTLRIASNHPWYAKLLAYPEFKSLVKQHLSDYESMLLQEFERLNQNSDTYIYKKYKKAFDRNFELWDVLGTKFDQIPKDVQAIDTIDGQFEYLYTWLTTRYQYMCTMYA